MTPAPRLCFAMLTYGALDATQRCVRSLAAHTKLPFELFVVDNGSTDGTRDWLAARTEPWLHWRCNAANRGVPGGRNDLFDFVLPQLGPRDWIVFIDNDLEFEAGWLEPFLAAMQHHAGAGVLGKVGHFVQVHAEGRTLLPAPTTTQSVDVVSGGFACFVRADAARAIGRFDEELGLFWHEDDDYCVRALHCGFDVVAVPEATIVHHEHASGVATPDLASGGSLQNQRYLAAKWRASGMIDRDGWVQRSGGPWLPPAVRDELHRRTGRAAPIARLELAAAQRLIEQMVEQNDPAVWLDQNRRPVPACTLALLAMHEESARQLGDQVLVAQLALVAAALPRACNATLLRPLLRTPIGCSGHDLVDVCPAGQGLCRSSDFDDEDFLAIAGEMGVGVVVRDAFARSRWQWEQVAVALQLARAGLAQPGCHVLLQDDEPPLLLAWLHLHGVTVHCGAEARAFDAILLPRLLDPDAVADVLRLAGPETLVVFSGDAVLNGAPSADAPQPHQLELDVLSRAGLRPVAPVNLHIDEAMLEACGLRPGDLATPILTQMDGAQLRTSFVLAARLSRITDTKVLIPAQPATPCTLRVGVDLRTLAQADSTARGIGKYTEHHLAALCELAPDVHFVGYVGDLSHTLPAALQRRNVTTRSIDDYNPADVDLVHLPDPMNMSFGFDSPLRTLRHERTTITFHDLTPMHHYVANWPRRNRDAYFDRLRQIERSNCELLTNSVFTADDVLAHTSIEPRRVTPILAGLHHGARQAPTGAQVTAVLAQLGVRPPFMLHVGAHDPHKNFHAALNAFLMVRARRPLQLVVVGAVDPGVAQAAAFCALRKVPDVVFTGYLPRRHLDALYASATGLLFLSRAEGFGFPILEAMAAGCPVIASNVTSHPEVAGDAALLIDPDDQHGAAAGIDRLLTEPTFEKQLRTRGLHQAHRFPWRAVAERTLAIWQRIGSYGAATEINLLASAAGAPAAEANR